MKPEEIQLLLLPGVGGDHRMFPAQLILPYRVIKPDLIDFLERETLQEYAKRFLELLFYQGSINASQPLFLGGASLGGAIAQEMSALIKTKGVILLGSFFSHQELRPLARIIARWTPEWLYVLATPFVKTGMRIVSGLDEEGLALAYGMYRSQNKKMMRRAMRALSLWEGTIVTSPMLRIHGSRDHIIPIQRTAGVDIVLSGAKHLISLSRGEEINQYIVHFLEKQISNTD